MNVEVELELEVELEVEVEVLSFSKEISHEFCSTSLQHILAAGRYDLSAFELIIL